MLRVRCIQHAPQEGPGKIEKWAREKGHELIICRLFDGDSLPSLSELDLLVVMGGPMSVHDEQAHPWLVGEKRFLTKAIQAEKKVLGVCLGAQLVAQVLGARVHRNPEREIGWFPVELTAAGQLSAYLAGFPQRLPVFHWHADTFESSLGHGTAAQKRGL